MSLSNVKHFLFPFKPDVDEEFHSMRRSPNLSSLRENLVLMFLIYLVSSSGRDVDSVIN